MVTRNGETGIGSTGRTTDRQLSKAGTCNCEGSLMHYGSGQAIRQAIRVAKPWQRYLIGVAMITAGAVLVTVGHIAGGLLAVAGVVLLWRMVRHGLRPSATTPRTSDKGHWR
jgi:hypothetical protein